MANKITAISALTFLITHVGITPTALAHDAVLAQEQCEDVLNSGDRSALQHQLELLLDEHPNHNCIPLIVGLLGGSPLASAGESDDHSDDVDRSSGGGGGGGEVGVTSLY